MFQSTGMATHTLIVTSVRLMGRVQQNMVLVKGKRTVILVAMKSTEASTENGRGIEK